VQIIPFKDDTEMRALSFSQVSETGAMRTAVVRRNRNPVWNEEFMLVILETSAAISITIYDKVQLPSFIFLATSA
jgi:Ca2+-dependent lipid-binding protein